MKSFEDRLGRLEEISREINQDCPLEEALKLFEEGIKLSKDLEKELSKIERKVEILVNTPDPEEAAGGEEPAEGIESPGTGGPRKTAGKEKPVLDLFPDLDDD